MITIVDYGMGNLASVANAFAALRVPCKTSSDPLAIAEADGLVLPGVGAFRAAMINIRRCGLDEALGAAVLDRRVPFLGICLGLQLIARSSTEGGLTEGLGWIDGDVTALAPDNGLPVPHVGWNQVAFQPDTAIFAGTTQGSHFYFDHSYGLTSGSAAVTATCDYGGASAAAVACDNIHAVQFHPEKSQRNGLRVLKAFANLVVGASDCTSTVEHGQC